MEDRSLDDADTAREDEDIIDELLKLGTAELLAMDGRTDADVLRLLALDAELAITDGAGSEDIAEELGRMLDDEAVLAAEDELKLAVIPPIEFIMAEEPKDTEPYPDALEETARDETADDCTEEDADALLTDDKTEEAWLDTTEEYLPDMVAEGLYIAEEDAATAGN